MYSRVRSLGLNGIEGYEITVECNIANGMGTFDVVGLPDAAVKESRDRVQAAIRNSGARVPSSHVTINLAPANTKKSGSLYDLPILLAVLSASGQYAAPPENAAFLGEVSLEGKLRPVPGVLPMALAAKGLGIDALYVPAENAAEATLADGLTVYAVKNITELAAHLSGEQPLVPAAPWVPSPPQSKEVLDFADVCGQETVKRAMEIAAAGGHNLLLIGPPGSGKSMLAKRLPSILPDMTRAESLEVTRIHSVAGQLSSKHPLVQIRPFRSPHSTISAPGLAGGGSVPRPGEISLAHLGVLFLDELPEFHRDVLEVLRQPLEDGVVTISRVGGTFTYPSNFMLVCAMNPCPCGWYGDPSDRCTCTPQAVQRYLSRISGPLLDRIDIIVSVPAVKFEELRDHSGGESSAAVKARVDAARQRQQARLAPDHLTCNAMMSTAQIRRDCELDSEAESLLRAAFDLYGMTARSYDRVLRVARTIADLEGSERVLTKHIAEAVQFRNYPLGSQT